MADSLSIESSKKTTLVIINIDPELKFDEKGIKTLGQKLNALSRIASLINVGKKRGIMKTFTESQFG